MRGKIPDLMLRLLRFDFEQTQTTAGTICARALYDFQDVQALYNGERSYIRRALRHAHRATIVEDAPRHPLILFHELSATPLKTPLSLRCSFIKREPTSEMSA